MVMRVFLILVGNDDGGSDVDDDGGDLLCSIASENGTQFRKTKANSLCARHDRIISYFSYCSSDFLRFITPYSTMNMYIYISRSIEIWTRPFEAYSFLPKYLSQQENMRRTETKTIGCGTNGPFLWNFLSMRYSVHSFALGAVYSYIITLLWFDITSIIMYVFYWSRPIITISYCY